MNDIQVNLLLKLQRYVIVSTPSWNIKLQVGVLKEAQKICSFFYPIHNFGLYLVLSGGETNRLQLARLMYRKTNFLILDEPTNHMDIQSREMIEQAVNQFPGTVLVVSHDRFFLDQLVDRVVEISEKKLVSWEGNFSDYFKAKYPVLPRLSGKIDTRGKERRRDKLAEAPSSGIPLETRIQEGEDEKLQLEKELKQALDNNRTQEGRKVAVKLEQLNSRLEKLYREWESFSLWR